MKPLMIFDGDCGFCRHWIHRWKIWTRNSVDYAPYQETTGLYPQLSLEKCKEAVQLIDSDGQVYSAAEAVFRSLSHAPGKKWPYRLYRKFPPFAAASEVFYRAVARNRVFFSRATRLLWGAVTEPSAFFVSRWIFLRLIALIYFAAFASMRVQIAGLLGSGGILPVHSLMDGARAQLGSVHFSVLPTIFWWNASDALLQAVCTSGCILSAMLFLGIGPQICLAALWFLYLSIASVGREFLSFQWDILLLETGFLAIFLAPFQMLPNPKKEDAPSGLALWLARVLLFKLMFCSGVVKLASGDETWKNLTALNYHYETQPLPNPISWYAHQLPASIQKYSTLAMFGVELLVPFLIFLPRRPRLWAGLCLIAFQTFILLTGNYCFFNWLTIALCVLLIDDAAWGSVRSRFPAFREALENGRCARIRKIVLLPLACCVLLLTPMQIGYAFRANILWPRPMVELSNALAPFESSGSYGLFAVMTRSRPEIIIEGSDDGSEWRAYEFKYKPGDPKRRPCWAAPHQPRLDWQMWFATLGNYRQKPWLVNFCVRLLQGSPSVTGLLETNPFPAAPPKYIRASYYDYHFTDFAVRQKEGTWWRREYLGLYLPVISLRQNGPS